MSTGEYSATDLVQVMDQVQNLIEGCIQHYMKKSVCKHALQFHYKINPDLTEIIWNRLEKENEGFFRAYYVQLVLIEQIEKFNTLFKQQVEWMRMITLPGFPAPMNTYDPSPDLIIPLRTVDILQRPMTHESGSSITSPTLRMGDVPHLAPQMGDAPHLAPQMGDVPYLAPQCSISYGAGLSNPDCQENVYMSGYDPNFRSSQHSVDPQNLDAMMTQTGGSVITRKAGYVDSLPFNPSSYDCFMELSALMGDSSINSLSSDAIDPTNVNVDTRKMY